MIRSSIQKIKLKLIKLKNIRKGNIIESQGYLHNVKFDIEGNNNRVLIGKDSQLLNSKIYIRGNNHILEIGQATKVQNSLLWFQDSYNKISIGDRTTIEGAHIAVVENNFEISIGEDCMLSHDISIRNSDSHSIIDLSTEKRVNHAKNIKIHEHVWVGAYVAIMKGVTVGNGSIIGIKSLVNSDLPPNSISAGVPAKPLKTGFSWKRERI